jgi:hypothetical protein
MCIPTSQWHQRWHDIAIKHFPGSFSSDFAALLVTASMDCQVDKAEARPRSTRIDEKVASAKEMIETTEILKGMKDVMNDMLARVQQDRSSHGRTQRKQIRLSLDAIDKMAPTVAKNADSIAPVRNLKYACSREARKEKQKAKMLQDISNSVGRGQQKKNELSSVQKLEKLVYRDRKLNPIRLQSKRKCHTNGHSSTGDKSKKKCQNILSCFAPTAEYWYLQSTRNA